MREKNIGVIRNVKKTSYTQLYEDQKTCHFFCCKCQRLLLDQLQGDDTVTREHLHHVHARGQQRDIQLAFRGMHH